MIEEEAMKVVEAILAVVEVEVEEAAPKEEVDGAREEEKDGVAV